MGGAPQVLRRRVGLGLAWGWLTHQVGPRLEKKREMGILIQDFELGRGACVCMCVSMTPSHSIQPNENQIVRPIL